MGDGALVGIGAIVLTGAKIGAGAVVGAGALVPEGASIPPGSLCVGVPARVVREVTEDETRRISEGAEHYLERKEIYRNL